MSDLISRQAAIDEFDEAYCNEYEAGYNDRNDFAVSKMTGWICPVCGRGLSPFTRACPCNDKWEITCKI